MIVLVVILAVVAAAAIVAAVVTSRRLAAQRALTATADQQAAGRAAELATNNDALERAGRERSAAGERAALANEQAQLAGDRAAAAAATAATADEQARVARDQAAAAMEGHTAAEERARLAEERADSAAEHARQADERAAAAEQRGADGAASPGPSDGAAGGIDPQVLWTLERARSERTWRHSVATGPDSVSVLADASDPLLEALQVELDAAREDVGAVVELDADLPARVTAAGSVLTLRAAQELLADVVRRAEMTTLHVHAEHRDVVVTVTGVDEHGEPVLPTPLPIPPSAAVVVVHGGVRVRNAIASADA